MIDDGDLSGEAYLRKVSGYHDRAEECLERLQKAEKALQEVADTLDADGPGDVPEAAERMQDRLRELQWRYGHEDAAWIAERTDKYGSDAEEVLNHFDRDPERVIEERELAEEIIHN